MEQDQSFQDDENSPTIQSIQSDLLKSISSNFQIKHTSVNDSRISPVVVYGVNRTQVPDIVQFDLEIEKYSKGAKIVKTSFDKLDNLLIWHADLESAESITNNQDLFPALKKVNLNLYPNKPAIIIKNITFDQANKYIDKLNQIEIIDIVNLKSKLSNSEPRRVKAICDSSETQKALLANKISLGYQEFPTEPCIRTPLQCKKCYSFGHKAESCNTQICPICSEDHDEEDCESKIFKCVNCKSSEHAAHNRSCPIFVKLKNDALNEYAIKTHKFTTNQKSQNNPGNTRLYSDITSDKEISEKISSLENLVNSNRETTIKSLKEELSNQFNKLNEPSKNGG